MQTMRMSVLFKTSEGHTHTERTRTMTISKLIQTLQTIQQQQGDQTITITFDHNGDYEGILGGNGEWLDEMYPQLTELVSE